MSTPFPGYTTNKAMLQPIRDLKVELGLNDSCIQGTEVAIRFLIESTNESGIDTQKFIQDLSKKYSISHGVNNFEKLHETSAFSYIVQTYNIVELFFRNLISEYQLHKNINPDGWKTQINKANIDPFNQLVENFPPAQKSILLSVPEKLMLDYYRLVRNSIVHNDDKAKKKAAKFYEDNIVSIKLHFKGYGLDAPNIPSEINFNDFVLYTRGLKYFALVINEACNLNANDLMHVSQETVFHKSVKRTYENSNPKTIVKTIKVIKYYYMHNYGKGTECLNEFIIKYMDLLKIPSKKYLQLL